MPVYGLVAAFTEVALYFPSELVVRIVKLYVFQRYLIKDLPAVGCSVCVDIKEFRAVFSDDIDPVCLFRPELGAQTAVGIDLKVEIVR